MAELQALGVMASAERPQARELTYADICELTYLNAVIKVCASDLRLRSQLSGLTCISTITL